jgi:hypothetical protein
MVCGCVPLGSSCTWRAAWLRRRQAEAHPGDGRAPIAPIAEALRRTLPLGRHLQGDYLLDVADTVATEETLLNESIRTAEATQLRAQVGLRHRPATAPPAAQVN